MMRYSMGGKKKWSSAVMSSTSGCSASTTEGTPTISSSLKARGMPYFDGSAYASSDYEAADGDESTTTYEEETDDDESRMGAGRDRSSSPPDELLLSVSDGKKRKSKRKSSSSSKKVVRCCAHGEPCSIGRAAAAESEKASHAHAPEYETVKISKLENPPDSFTRRRSSTQLKREASPKRVFRCKYPSGMSSIASPSLSRDATDGVYENINQLNKLQKSASSLSVDTANPVSTSDSQGEKKKRRRRRGPNILDLYIGAMVRKEAEKHVKRNTHFRLYHRIPSNAASNLDYVKDHISLYIVYKSCNGDYYHFAIQRSMGTSNGKSVKQYHLDCDGIYFHSLDVLVNYYSVYVVVDVDDETADIFPISTKRKQRERKNRDEEYQASESKSRTERKSRGERREASESKSRDDEYKKERKSRESRQSRKKRRNLKKSEDREVYY